MNTSHRLSLIQQEALDFREERDWAQWHHAKTLGIGLFVEAGELAEHFLYHRDHELMEHLHTHIIDVSDELSDVFYWLIIIAYDAGFTLEEAFLHKMKKNLHGNTAKNYPPVVMEIPKSVGTIQEMIDLAQKLRAERGWNSILDPRDLLYKLIEEIGEIAEYFEWRHLDDLREYLQSHQWELAEEVADALTCVILLADSLQIDLEEAFRVKMVKNRKKYPI